MQRFHDFRLPVFALLGAEAALSLQIEYYDRKRERLIAQQIEPRATERKLNRLRLQRMQAALAERSR